jgi:hypothetical protein
VKDLFPITSHTFKGAISNLKKYEEIKILGLWKEKRGKNRNVKQTGWNTSFYSQNFPIAR